VKALGIHTYAGGFMLGLKKAGVETLGSIETYKQPMTTAALLGVKRLEEVQHADLVVANPPCSRFSPTATSNYTEEQRSQVCEFPELAEVLLTGLQAHADIVWWETGPYCFTRGRGLIEDASKRLSDGWHRDVTTLVLKLDALYTGLPQRRPRTHVIHVKGKLGSVPGLPATSWPVAQTLQEFVTARQVGAVNVEPVPVFSKGVDGWCVDPKKWQVHYLSMGEHRFMSGTPMTYTPQARIAATIFGGRWFSWKEPRRFWSIAEYAALMGYPVNVDYNALWPNPKQQNMTWQVFTQSVSPDVASWVAKNVVIPLQAGWLPQGPNTPVETREDHKVTVHYYRCFDGKLHVDEYIWKEDE
jgi:site-specific DNA-cytosine methylase